jgi:predicted metal-binding membrane protein
VSRPSLIENLLRRDRTVVVLALALIIGVSWLYILAGAGMGMSALDMTSLPKALGPAEEVPMNSPLSEERGGPPAPKSTMPSGLGGVGGTMAAMATPVDWTFRYALLMFFMWWVMMIAMMLPSAAPMILLHARVERSAKARAGEVGGLAPTVAFTFGYLLVWGLFSAIAAALQWAFERGGLLSPMTMNATSMLFAGVILLFAGAYQVTPIKQACLKHCRGPIQFLSRHWRPGAGGALRMGVHHGTYCLGCCWGLMAILFFGGVMNLYWIVGLALIVLLEKLVPLGPRFGTVIGGLLLIWGASFLVRALALA